MKGRPIIERQISHLDEEQYKKIFPQEYYRKYATHIKILQFQKDLFRHSLQHNKKKPFTSRKTLLSHNSTEKIPKIKLNKYDLVADTIEKNRGETTRMQQFVSNLNKKLKVGSSAKNLKTIRSPISGFEELQTNVVEKMRYIQNQEYEAQVKKWRQKKTKEIEYVKFRKRGYRSMSNLLVSNLLEKSIIAESSASRSIKSIRDDRRRGNMSNTMELHPIIVLDAKARQRMKSSIQNHLTYKQRLQNLMLQARSEIVSINPEERHGSVKYIMAMNKSIKKINGLKDSVSKEKLRMMGSGLGIMLKRSQTIGSEIISQKKKKLEQGELLALMQLNKGVRSVTNNMQVLSRYQNLMRQRELQSFLKPIQ